MSRVNNTFLALEQRQASAAQTGAGSKAAALASLGEALNVTFFSQYGVF